MRIDKLLNGVKNIKQVYEGVKNRMFKKQYIEDIADYRWKQCKDCDELDLTGDKCAMKGTQPCCGDCGCSLSIKTRSLSSECPLKGDKKRWSSLMTEDEEFKLRAKLEEDLKK